MSFSNGSSNIQDLFMISQRRSFVLSILFTSIVLLFLVACDLQSAAKPTVTSAPQRATSVPVATRTQSGTALPAVATTTAENTAAPVTGTVAPAATSSQ